MSVVLYTLLFLHISFPCYYATYTSSSPLSTLLRQQPQPGENSSSSSRSPCPLDFDAFRRKFESTRRHSLNISNQCHYIRQGLRLVQSDYLRRTNSFFPPINTTKSCKNSYQSLVNHFIPNFNISRSCSIDTSCISLHCMNITTRSEFESKLSPRALSNIISSCNRSLENYPSCDNCTRSLYEVMASPSVAKVSDCLVYVFNYAAAFANHFGPTNKGTAKCLFASHVHTAATSSKGKKNNSTDIIVIAVGSTLVFILGVSGCCWFLWRRRRNKLSCKRTSARSESNLASRFDLMRGSATLVSFTFDEIKAATKNFSNEHIIGRGGYGNVYKGVLPGGSEVALKRFKNCSAGGHSDFIHELEVIASVRHVNLLGLRGYCTATSPLEGHQRIIVCDLVKNGSLYDHLFGLRCNRLSWPIRQKIAIGTARGLAYLHYGAQPAIIHRDIKANNILLDENFEPKVADFGLAKFNPEGMTHLSTRVAGTMGYVAPEYALYGQLTERSDVYSFGVVLLELLSGKKALIAVNDGKPTLMTDWAWSVVKEGKPLDVVEDNIPDLAHPEILEKYVMVAVLCSHPQLYARPMMDQVVKMLEADMPIPNIPERPIPFIADLDDIERPGSSNGSGNMSISTSLTLGR
ncbi:probable LRR receptor-like serine/threonine-protein kinase RKF3 [Lycium barbarum]|uniref:probable LRR receptor-like serine/threonine-protein kinase RKF3 n=1 Tax=Lycium barbarum TaxID=112863 RepID=UPI00293E341C|nr:probable LRR receptor-like serine/threonine-protein kinase RKF3 [Lycium barbarum]